MKAEASALLLPAEEAYRLLARGYDAAPNPLLSLEERYLAGLLPAMMSCDVVDLGCGTGRWLCRIAGLAPRSLTGIDLSAEMLNEAAKKLTLRTRLIRANCVNTSLADDSVDWLLSSFLLSYIDRPRDFAREAARIARSGARLVLSDVHPATRNLGWKRTFRHEMQLIEIETHAYRVEELHDAMRDAGFVLTSCDDYCFGEEEKIVFDRAERSDLYARVEGKPVLLMATYRRT
jgi:ubiquinone/menaquinone biosynthesis C-methylase UbiE